MIVNVDGGRDKNPRYEKTISCVADYFNTFVLEAFFLVTNAPGRSAFDTVERRMATLSKEFDGVLLEHKHFGLHLDDKGKTVDPQFKPKHFEHAYNILGKIWNGMAIGGYPVKVEHIGDKASGIFNDVSEKLRSSHVRLRQYLLQIVKSNDIASCMPFRLL